MKSFHPAFLLFVLPAVLLFVAPAVVEHFAFERGAILHGEWWRLWTGHWIHFSASHLCWNLLVAVAAGSWLESLQPGRLWRYTMAAAPVISGALLALEPAMQTYGGLSGLATGLVVLLALGQISGRGAGRAWGWGLLLLVTGKIILEAAHGAALFSRFVDDAIRPSTLAHAAGAGSALVFFVSSRAARRSRHRPGEALASPNVAPRA